MFGAARLKVLPSFTEEGASISDGLSGGAAVVDVGVVGVVPLGVGVVVLGAVGVGVTHGGFGQGVTSVGGVVQMGE